MIFGAICTSQSTRCVAEQRPSNHSYNKSKTVMFAPVATCASILQSPHLSLSSSYQRRQLFKDTLTRIPMLSELTEEDRMNLVDCLSSRTFDDGDIIIHQGDMRAESMFFIEDGIVSIRVRQNEVSRVSFGHKPLFGPSVASSIIFVD